MKLFTYSEGSASPALRGGGNPWLQWTVMVWTMLALQEYFTRTGWGITLAELLRYLAGN